MQNARAHSQSGSPLIPGAQTPLCPEPAAGQARRRLRGRGHARPGPAAQDRLPRVPAHEPDAGRRRRRALIGAATRLRLSRGRSAEAGAPEHEHRPARVAHEAGRDRAEHGRGVSAPRPREPTAIAAAPRPPASAASAAPDATARLHGARVRPRRARAPAAERGALRRRAPPRRPRTCRRGSVASCWTSSTGVSSSCMPANERRTGEDQGVDDQRGPAAEQGRRVPRPPRAPPRIRRSRSRPALRRPRPPAPPAPGAGAWCRSASVVVPSTARGRPPRPEAPHTIAVAPRRAAAATSPRQGERATSISAPASSPADATSARPRSSSCRGGVLRSSSSSARVAGPITESGSAIRAADACSSGSHDSRTTTTVARAEGRSRAAAPDRVLRGLRPVEADDDVRLRSAHAAAVSRVRAARAGPPGARRPAIRVRGARPRRRRTGPRGGRRARRPPAPAGTRARSCARARAAQALGTPRRRGASGSRPSGSRARPRGIS